METMISVTCDELTEMLERVYGHAIDELSDVVYIGDRTYTYIEEDGVYHTTFYA